MYSKNYVLITLASTIIISLLYRYYNNKKNKDNKKLLKSKPDNQHESSESDAISEYSNDAISEYSNDAISEYSIESIDSEYYPNWNNLLSELIKNGENVFDTHICKVDKNRFQPVLDMRNHLNRFWIKKSN